MIGVFSGTSDGRAVVEALLEKNYEIVCFNATVYGGSLYEAHENLTVYDHKMDYEELIEKASRHKLEYIIDCTHPFAEVISKNLMKIAEAKSINYLRYERPQAYEGSFDTYDQIIEVLKKTKGKIFLTIGSNNLQYFTNTDLLERLYVRVLPTVNVIKKCVDLGLTPKQIIGIQGPFSKAFNMSTMTMLDIKHMVTKSSGQAGGLKEKLEAAQALDINTYVLNRPSIEYKKIYESINELLKEF